MPLKLSVLDQSPIKKGSTVREALIEATQFSKNYRKRCIV